MTKEELLTYEPKIDPDDLYRADDWAYIERYDHDRGYVALRHQPTGLEIVFSAWEAAAFGDHIIYAAKNADKAWVRNVLDRHERQPAPAASPEESA